MPHVSSLRVNAFTAKFVYAEYMQEVMGIKQLNVALLWLDDHLYKQVITSKSSLTIQGC
jgi:hypothetical protein